MMGYLRHQVVIAEAWYEPDIQRLNESLESINHSWECGEGGMYHASNLVLRGSPQVNGHVTFIFTVDGSKEGWDASDHADELRRMFVNACQETKYASWAVLLLGGDDRQVQLMDSSEKERNRRDEEGEA